MAIQGTNTTGKPLDLLGTRGGPGIVVVKDGVAEPLPEDLAGRRWTFEPGQTATWQVAMDVRRCDPGGGLPGTAVLQPGSYDLYATKIFSDSRDVDLPRIVVGGGPWRIDLR